MAGKREKPEDIVIKLRQVEVLQGQGMSVAEAVLRAVVRCVGDERPLSGKVEGANVLKKLSKFRLWRHAHGSIRVQEPQPILPKTDCYTRQVTNWRARG